MAEKKATEKKTPAKKAASKKTPVRKAAAKKATASKKATAAKKATAVKKTVAGSGARVSTVEKQKIQIRELKHEIKTLEKKLAKIRSITE
jgi:hypothetical protein